MAAQWQYKIKRFLSKAMQYCGMTKKLKGRLDI